MREAFKVTAADITKFWVKTRIPMRDPQHTQNKITGIILEMETVKEEQMTQNA